MNETPTFDALAELALVRGELDTIRVKLARSERECERIAKLSPERADQARRRLDGARRAFGDARLRLIRTLDLLSMDEPRADQARNIILERNTYPSAAAAGALFELTERLTPAQESQAARKAPTLADELAAAMRKRGDNKKSAAGHIAISPKTLDRLLRGEPTKPVKQQAARRYIEETSDLK